MPDLFIGEPGSTAWKKADLPAVLGWLLEQGFYVSVEVNPGRVDSTRDTGQQSFVTFHVSRQYDRRVASLKGLMAKNLAGELESEVGILNDA